MLPSASFFIDIEGNRLHYVRMGTGPQALLAFHGFGQHQAHFRQLSEVLSSRYTLYAIDIFFHGKSTWRDCEKTISEGEWKIFMGELLLQQDIERFSLLGYSLGGKLALCTLQLFPGRVEKLILIAPDGIKTNFWYNMATYPYWFRKVFRSSVSQPRLFFRLVSILSRYKMVDKSLARFAAHHMNSRRKRHKVYCTWIVFRHLVPRLREVAAIINRHHIVLELFAGRYDRVIRPRHMQRLLRRLKKYHFRVLQKGHNTLIQDVANYYQKNR